MLISVCDDYNIVEPRFYSGDDVVELGDCGADLTDFSVFSVNACWLTGRPERSLAFAWRTMDSGPLKVTILNSAGVVETVVADGQSIPSAIVLSGDIPWGDREDGVYGISMQSKHRTVVVWFEVN